MGRGDQGLDQLRRKGADLVADLHERKLAIPAGVLLVALVAAVFVLPKSSSPPPPAPATTTATPVQTIERPAQVSLKLVGASSLEDDIPLTDSSNPFSGTSSANCSRVGSGEPKQFDCRIGVLLVRIRCPRTSSSEPGTGICAAKAAGGADGGGGTAATGGSDAGGGATGGGGDGSSPAPVENAPKPEPKEKVEKEPFYTVTATLDGSVFRGVEPGDGVPSKDDSIVVFAGVDEEKKNAIFLAAENMIVVGAEVDPALGSFELPRGKSAMLIDPSGVEHKLTVNRITKVSK